MSLPFLQGGGAQSGDVSTWREVGNTAHWRTWPLVPVVPLAMSAVPPTRTPTHHVLRATGCLWGLTWFNSQCSDDQTGAQASLIGCLVPLVGGDGLGERARLALVLSLVLILSGHRLHPPQLCSAPFLLLDSLKGYLGSHISHKQTHA